MMIQFVLKNARLLAIVWALVIFALCAMPGQYIPSVSLLELLSFDKFVHAGMFYVLCTLVFFYLKQTDAKKSLFYIYLFAAILYGCLLEVMQGLVFSNRSADWQDMLANSLGCFLAIIFFNKLQAVLN